jgi:8-oxo-dGTP pyrophosphatase MutT (NUDIX family)
VRITLGKIGRSLPIKGNAVEIRPIIVPAKRPSHSRFGPTLAALRLHPDVFPGRFHAVPATMSPDPAQDPWKPAATVAAVIERDGRFLFVEERTRDGLRINQPAGHLDPGESLLEACTRETLEETAYHFTPTQLLGVYLWRSGPAASAPTYLRFAFTGALGEAMAGRLLDEGIVRTLWLTPTELAQRSAMHRSPLVMRCVEDFLRGQRYPIDLLFTHPSALEPPR